MIHTFIISHERIFPIEKRCKVQVGRKLLSMEADPFHTENKELGLLEKKIRFISIQNNDMEVHE
jgi:hypothetical protein